MGPSAGIIGRPAPGGYSRLQIVLHWTIAALILLQFLNNEGIQEAFDDRVDGDSKAAGAYALFHIVVGAAILALAALRLTIRIRRGAPEHHKGTPAIIALAASATHAALYMMIFAMPLTGLIAWLAGSEDVAEWHEIGRLILLALVAFHILGALAEHFVMGSRGLLRIVRPAG